MPAPKGFFWFPQGHALFDDANEEYKKFQRCLPQMIDDDSMLGDLDGKWVIFKDGWVYGLASYESYEAARQFGEQLFRDEPGACYIIVQVDLEQHQISPLHLLGDALSQIEFEAEDASIE